MTNTEIKTRIDELEKRRFYLSMKDRWDAVDFDNDRKLHTEILGLKKKLGEIK